MASEISIIEKNSTDELRVALKEFKGHRYVDVRTFVDPYEDHGQGRVPTKKGVTIAPAKLPALIEALQKAQKEAGEDGAADV